MSGAVEKVGAVYDSAAQGAALEKAALEMKCSARSRPVQFCYRTFSLPLSLLILILILILIPFSPLARRRNFAQEIRIRITSESETRDLIPSKPDTRP